MKVNANTIQKELMIFAASNTQEVVIPNYYISNFECDLLKISRNGYSTEYEIKVSRSDFKNDFQKAKRHWYSKELITTKHEIIRQGNRVSRFYFVVPEGLITLDEVPKEFGLIYYSRSQFRIIRTSKLFRKEPITHKEWIHIAQRLSLKLTIAKRNRK